MRCLILLMCLACLVRADEAAPVSGGDTNRQAAVNSVKLLNGFKYEILVLGDMPEPVYLQFCPDGRLWFTGRRGDIWAYDFAQQKHELVTHLKVCWEPIPGKESNERGLHGIEFDPGYKTNGFVYLYYSPVYENAWSNRIARFTVDNPERAAAFKDGSEQVMLEWVSSKGFHQGGALQYNPVDGCLYATVGDNNVSDKTRDFFGAKPFACISTARFPRTTRSWARAARILLFIHLVTAIRIRFTSTGKPDVSMWARWAMTARRTMKRSIG
jgi:glucose/arabinose dehydrogenase